MLSKCATYVLDSVWQFLMLIVYLTTLDHMLSCIITISRSMCIRWWLKKILTRGFFSSSSSSRLFKSSRETWMSDHEDQILTCMYSSCAGDRIDTVSGVVFIVRLKVICFGRSGLSRVDRPASHGDCFLQDLYAEAKMHHTFWADGAIT